MPQPPSTRLAYIVLRVHIDERVSDNELHDAVLRNQKYLFQNMERDGVLIEGEDIRILENFPAPVLDEPVALKIGAQATNGKTGEAQESNTQTSAACNTAMPDSCGGENNFASEQRGNVGRNSSLISETRGGPEDGYAPTAGLIARKASQQPESRPASLANLSHIESQKDDNANQEVTYENRSGKPGLIIGGEVTNSPGGKETLTTPERR